MKCLLKSKLIFTIAVLFQNCPEAARAREKNRPCTPGGRRAQDHTAQGAEVTDGREPVPVSTENAKLQRALL